MSLSPLLDPRVPIAKALGAEYDPAFEYRLVSDRNAGAAIVKGWEPTGHKAGALTLYRRPIPTAADIEVKPAPFQPPPKKRRLFRR